MSPMHERRRPDLRLGDRLSLTIDHLGDGGDGLARLDDYVIIVPGTLPGEQVFATITSAGRKHGRAHLLRVEQPSRHRVAPACPHFLACGGCDLQHLDYARQLRHKQEQLQRLLTYRLGDGAPTVAPTIAPPDPWHRRNKVVLHFGQDFDGHPFAGFHRARSIELVPIERCPTSDDDALELCIDAADLLLDLRLPPWSERRPDGLLRSVLVRMTTLGEAHLLVVAAHDHVPGLRDLLPALHRAGATTIALNVNPEEPSRLLGPQTTILSGPPRIRERIDGVDYMLSPTAFFQTSPDGARTLVRLVAGFLAPERDDVVADLYCGVGLFALALAGTARDVLGCERNPAAIADAMAAAAHGGIRNARFFAGAVHEWLRRCGDDLPRPQLVVLDPPRTGCEPEVLDELARLRPQRIAYVACDPQALGRDLLALRERGFGCSAVTPVDMFPHTAHIEAMACLLPNG